MDKANLKSEETSFQNSPNTMERERENLFDFALRTDTIMRLIIHKKNH